MPVIVPRRLRAPAEDGAVLADPPLEQAGTLVTTNRRLFAGGVITLLGRSLEDLRREGRRSAITAAVEYLRQSHETLPGVQSDSSLILAGHQPELFHPGVWAKNFALYGLSARHNCTPLNLVVDNDVAKSPVLQLPDAVDLADGRPTLLELPFDAASRDTPYEERVVLDEELFRSLPERADPVLRKWRFPTLLPKFWAEAVRQAERTPLLGERLAASRRGLERAWGCRNLEVPLSHLCRTEPFAWFASHLLSDFERFHAVHNETLSEYRRINGVRSRSHPVPDLGSDGEWLEVPFWIWPPENPQRGRLMTRRRDGRIELRSALEPTLELPSLSGRDGAAMATGWRGLEARGFKLRTRALTTTLFARLVLADLFIHGIGGAKYDELNDEIIRRFYGFEPPAYLVLSATLLLPFQLPSIRLEDTRRLAREIRDVRCNPQRHLADGALVDTRPKQLAAEKRAWIERQPEDGPSRRARFYRLKSLTEELGVFTQPIQHSLRTNLSECERRLKRKALLSRRDYAFCLFPEDRLRAFLRRFLEV
jgi:hypothetical protein